MLRGLTSWIDSHAFLMLRLLICSLDRPALRVARPKGEPLSRTVKHWNSGCVFREPGRMPGERRRGYASATDPASGIGGTLSSKSRIGAGVCGKRPALVSGA